MEGHFIILIVLVASKDAFSGGFFWFIIFARTILFNLCIACSQLRNGIALKSSLNNEKRTAACPGEAVVYTCTVPNTGVLQWAVESFHTFETHSIIFSLQYDPVGTVVQEEEGQIVANVTVVVPNMIYLGAITSTLTLLPNERFQNKTVWCGDGVLDETECPCMQNKYGGKLTRVSSLCISIGLSTASSPINPTFPPLHHYLS